MAQNQKGRNPAGRGDNQRKQTNDPNRPDSKQKNLEEQENKEQKGSKHTAKREDVTEGYGSSQQRDDKNVGPMDAELDDLPSESGVRSRESFLVTSCWLLVTID